MRYHKIETNNMDNGDGLRVVMWLSGCSHHCKGCHNPETWDESYGKIFETEALKYICDQLDKEHISGITLTGGDPLYHNNIHHVRNLVDYLKIVYPSKTIWLYTGYTWEELKEMMKENTDILDILGDIDVLVDGRYIEELRDTSLMWRGSPNQRVIDSHNSLMKNNLLPCSHIPLEDNVKKLLEANSIISAIVKSTYYK